MFDAIVIRPGKLAEKVQIEGTYEEIRGIIQDDLEYFYPFPNDDVFIICAENGKIDNRPFNRAIVDDYGNVVDLIAGDFLIVGFDDENYDTGIKSLSPDLMDRYYRKFKLPEMVVRTEQGIIIIRFENGGKEL